MHNKTDNLMHLGTPVQLTSSESDVDKGGEKGGGPSPNKNFINYDALLIAR